MTWTLGKRVGLVIAVLVLAAACSGRSDNAESSDAGAAEEAGVTEQLATDSEAAGDNENAAAAEDGGGSALAVDTVALGQSRDVVRSGSMKVSVDDADAAVVDIRRLAAAAGG
ncbi:MAG: hypothetical protein ACRDZN_14300, partial [Acidimicrobiales bacterium]